jgi:hypothetical protein
MRSRFGSLVLFAATQCLAPACSSSQPRVVQAQQGVPPHRRDVGDYSPDIRDEATWRALAATPGREAFAHTEVVKVIIDLEDDWRVYFLQSERWEIHYFFASRFLDRPGHPIESHEAFNQREYRQQDRRFVLGTVVHYRDADVWSYELVAGDVLDLPRTARAFEAVRRHVFFGDRLRYRPVPAQQETRIADLRALGVPIVTTQQIFGSMRYQPLNPGDAYGYLRFVHGAPNAASVRRNDIVVLDNVPLDLPVCAGVITTEFQTPLSHVNVLAVNRGTPNMALRDAMTHDRLRPLEGRLVHLHVGPQDWSIESATQDRAERAWEAQRPRTAFSPPLDTNDHGLPGLETLRAGDVSRVGAKAAQLGELAAIEPHVPIPRGFALPFHAYVDHLHRNHIDADIAAMLADAGFQRDPTERERRLAAVRERIDHAPVDPALLTALRARIAQTFPHARVRFRSSTNAEDLPGFNGAGLYRSVVAPADASEAQIADALRAVWASVWGFQAYEERTYFRMDPNRVAMAILVQESVDDDRVDGVAITANPFNAGRPALFVNAQLAGDEGGSVTSARGDDVPEQILYYTYGDEGEFERLSRSSRLQEGTVLRDDEVLRLAGVLRAIHAHFIGSNYESDRAMDVEFVFAGPQRRLVVVQARPIHLRHDEGRGWAAPP